MEDLCMVCKNGLLPMTGTGATHDGECHDLLVQSVEECVGQKIVGPGIGFPTPVHSSIWLKAIRRAQQRWAEGHGAQPR